MGDYRPLEFTPEKAGGNDGKGLFKSLKSIPTEHAVQFGHI